MKLHTHKRRDPRHVSELSIHISVIDALRQFAAPGVVFYHAANGELRDKRAAAKLRAMGVRPGVADISLLIPATPWARPAYMELKSTKGRLSLDQRIFRADVTDIGCLYAEPRSVDEALSILIEWGALTGMARSSISSAALRGKAA